MHAQNAQPPMKDLVDLTLHWSLHDHRSGLLLKRSRDCLPKLYQLRGLCCAKLLFSGYIRFLSFYFWKFFLVPNVPGQHFSALVLCMVHLLNVTLMMSLMMMMSLKIGRTDVTWQTPERSSGWTGGLFWTLPAKLNHLLLLVNSIAGLTTRWWGFGNTAGTTGYHLKYHR